MGGVLGGLGVVGGVKKRVNRGFKGVKFICSAKGTYRYSFLFIRYSFYRILHSFCTHFTVFVHFNLYKAIRKMPVNH